MFGITDKKKILYFLFVFGVANFMIFIMVASFLGGDASNGHYAAGHFFLANHNRLTEVSEGVYTYSLWHSRSLYFTHPLALISVLLLNFSQKTAL
jgi:hypothetical protein